MPLVWERMYPTMETELRESEFYLPYRQDREKMRNLLHVFIDPVINLKGEILSKYHAKLSSGNKFYENIGLILDDSEYRVAFIECMDTTIGQYGALSSECDKGDKGVSKWQQGLNVKLKNLFQNVILLESFIFCVSMKSTEN